MYIVYIYNTYNATGPTQLAILNCYPFYPIMSHWISMRWLVSNLVSHFSPLYPQYMPNELSSSVKSP